MKVRFSKIVLPLIALFFFSCSEEGNEIPDNSKPFHPAFIRVDSEEYVQSRGIVVYNSEALGVFQSLDEPSVHIPSSGGTFVISASDFEYGCCYTEDYVGMEFERMDILSIFSPLNSHTINVEEAVNKANLAGTGISDIKRLSATKYKITFEQNLSGHHFVFKVKIDTPENLFPANADFVIWPEGSVVDKYYDGEMTREEAVAAMKNENLSYF